jgi:hypothetical protein
MACRLSSLSVAVLIRPEVAAAAAAVQPAAGRLWMRWIHLASPATAGKYVKCENFDGSGSRLICSILLDPEYRIRIPIYLHYILDPESMLGSEFKIHRSGSDILVRKGKILFYQLVDKIFNNCRVPYLPHEPMDEKISKTVFCGSFFNVFKNRWSCLTVRLVCYSA